MRSSAKLIRLPMMLFAVATAAKAQASDYCDLYGSGTSRYYVPDVTKTFSSSSWANSSARRVQADLSSTSKTGILVWGADSPMTLYVFTEDAFSGSFSGIRCPMGYWCSVTAPVTVKSFICQRDFAHRGTGSISNKLNHPTIPTSAFVSPIADAFATTIGGSANVESYTDRTTQVRWVTGHNFNLTMGHTPVWSDRYNDLINIYKTFNIDPDAGAWDWATGNYDVEIQYFMAPVLYGSDLHFWWAGHSVDVESGLLDDEVLDAVMDGLAGFDSQTMLDEGVRKAAGELLCVLDGDCGSNPSDATLIAKGSSITDGKARLQMGHATAYASYTTSLSKIPSASTSSTAADIQLNSDRNAK